NWEDAVSPASLVGIIHEDGTASGTFFSHSFGCGTSASNWSLESDAPPSPQPKPEDFEVDLAPDTTEATEGPVTITVATTSDSDITSLKWLEGNRSMEDFDGTGNEIDLTTKSFTVGENGMYTIYALNAEGVAALSTITISNITDPGDGTDPDDGTELGEGTDPDDGTDPDEGTDADKGTKREY